MERDEIEWSARFVCCVICPVLAVLQEVAQVRAGSTASCTTASDAGGWECAADAGDGVVVEGVEFECCAVPICVVLLRYIETRCMVRTFDVRFVPYLPVPGVHFVYTTGYLLAFGCMRCVEAFG